MRKILNCTIPVNSPFFNVHQIRAKVGEKRGENRDKVVLKKKAYTKLEQHEEQASTESEEITLGILSFQLISM